MLKSDSKVNTKVNIQEMIGAIASGKLRADLHNHSLYSDGKSTPEEIVLSAIDKRLDVIGISDHAPVGFKDARWSIRREKIDEYIYVLGELKEKYKDKITLLTGLEVDYYKDCDEHIKALRLTRFDYTIGSVHFFSIKKAVGDYYGIDSSPIELAAAIVQAKGVVQNVCQDYFTYIVKAAKSGYFSFVGHFDLIKKYNFDSTYFVESEEWYQTMSKLALAEIAAANIPMEINTSASRKGHNDYYPSKFLVEEARRLGITLITNSDSHHKDEVGYGQG
ncbi:MAG: histidinol-phosphatase [Oligoflexia bacterium]|nr:histidinol-phosphatase [Oligoflexia bacterium]MBF0366504.1 histidinol-phosphatase [Oligoflexia bacterium]